MVSQFCGYPNWKIFKCIWLVGWLSLQSALTGESMPATKKPGDEVFSGSTCKQGEIEAVVIATGVHTFFGKAAHLVDSTNNVGHFQKVRLSVCSHQLKFR